MKQGWETKKLGDVCEVIGGGTPSKANKKFYEGDVYWATVRDMKGDVIKETEYRITKDAIKNSSTNIIPKGNVVIATRVGLGKVCLIENDTAINQDLRGIVPKPKSKLAIGFLFQWFKSISHLIVEEGTGATIQGVKLPFIKGLPIPIPPLPEQQRIVAILDESFAAIAKAKANAEQNLKNAKELFESYLQSVFENKGEGWEEKSIGEICDLMTGGTPSSSKPEYYQHGTIKWLVSGDVNIEEITDCEGRITDLGFENSNTKYLPVNSVIIALNGQGKTRGTVAMLRTKATCNQSLVSIYPKDVQKLLPEYIFYNLKVRYQEIRKITGDSGNDRRGLNMPLIRSIKVPYPESINQQKSFVNKFSIILAETKKLETIYQQKINDLEELKKSILQKAFSGELKTSKEVAA